MITPAGAGKLPSSFEQAQHEVARPGLAHHSAQLLGLQFDTTQLNVSIRSSLVR
jgi:hypothetical protein